MASSRKDVFTAASRLLRGGGALVSGTTFKFMKDAGLGRRWGRAAWAFRSREGQFGWNQSVETGQSYFHSLSRGRGFSVHPLLRVESLGSQINGVQLP